MSHEEQRYREVFTSKLENVSLPSIDEGWNRMEALLEKKDDDRRPFLLWWKGCLPVVLVGLLLLGGFGLMYWNKNYKEDIEKNKTTLSHNKELKKKDTIKSEKNILAKDKISTENNDVKGDEDTVLQNEVVVTNKTVSINVNPNKKEILTEYIPQINTKSGGQRKTHQQSDFTVPNKKILLEVSPKILSKNTNKEPFLNNSRKAKKVITRTSVVMTTDLNATNKSTTNLIDDTDKKQTDLNVPNAIKTGNAGITSSQKPNDSTGIKIEKDSSITKPDTAISKEKQTIDKEKKEKSTWFSVGLGERQQLPLAGQKYNPFNAQGRKNSLLEYIPSLQVGWHKTDKWLLQAEYKYGAPQTIQPNSYQVSSDSIVGTSKQRIINNGIKKTFYQQLSLNTNVNLSKRILLGAGVVYNRFQSAIVYQDIINRDRITLQDSVISKDQLFVLKKADSNFAKSFFQASINARYTWQRFALGARYQMGFQPFFKGTGLTGTALKLNQNSVELFFQYDIWRNKPREKIK